MQSTTTLTLWRRDVAGLSLALAARKNGMSQTGAAAFELRPGNATVNALRTYVLGCGGRLSLVVEIHGITRELSL